MLHQPQAHLPRRLVLGGVIRVCKGREHEVGTDRDIPGLEHLLRFLLCEGDVLFQFASERCADVDQPGAMVLRQDLNTEGLHIVAGYLPELLVVLLGGMVGIPIDPVTIYPNMRINAIPQVGVVRDLLFPPDIFEPKDQLVYHAVIVVQQRQTERLPYMLISHATPLYRHLRGEDQELQENKVANLRLAVARLDGIVLYPGETFSYWRLIGKPTRRKGYRDGMVLFLGRIGSDVGGGLCQLSNLIFWMTLHTPLTVVERYRHSHDVFPDTNRTQPFGSGATCAYPHRDLMIRNDTEQPFQLCVQVGKQVLKGEWRAPAPPVCRYEIVERNHRMDQASWGGYVRHNELYRRIYDLEGGLLEEEFLFANDAIMMYSPLLPEES